MRSKTREKLCGTVTVVSIKMKATRRGQPQQQTLQLSEITGRRTREALRRTCPAASPRVTHSLRLPRHYKYNIYPRRTCPARNDDALSTPICRVVDGMKQDACSADAERLSSLFTTVLFVQIVVGRYRSSTTF